MTAGPEDGEGARHGTEIQHLQTLRQHHRKINDSGVPVVCCGEKMTGLVPNTTDGTFEKHVPAWTVSDGVVHVQVGSAGHPMQAEHYIEWVSIHATQGSQRKKLRPGDKPEVCFALCESDEVEAVYAYCNLYSLWKA